MTQPTFSQLKTLSTAVASINPETLQERILTCLAILCGGQNPDGTTFTQPVTTVPTPPAAANILDGIAVLTATQAATTLITIPQGRTWQGTIAASCAVQNAGANAAVGQATCLFTVAGAGATPAAGAIFEVDALAGANVAAGTVGDQGNNYGAIQVTVIAPAANSVTIATTITITGTGGRVAATAVGTLIA